MRRQANCARSQGHTSVRRPARARRAPGVLWILVGLLWLDGSVRPGDGEGTPGGGAPPGKEDPPPAPGEPGGKKKSNPPAKKGAERAKDGPAPAGPGGPGAAPKKANPSGSTPGKKAPPRSNLGLPGDLAPDQKKLLEEAIEAFKAAVDPTTASTQGLTQAIEKLKKASQRAFKTPLPHYYLGIAYQQVANLPQARTALEKAVKLSPEFHEALVSLGDVNVGQKKLKEAIGLYKRALEIEPQYVSAYDRKAVAEARLGLVADARSTLTAALAIEADPGRRLFLAKVESELHGPPWKTVHTVETDNYKVLTGISREYATEIGRHAELIRRAYDVIFSDIGKPARKFEIWVYEDLDAYHKVIGNNQVLGHYEPLFRKLVVPRQKSREETFRTLYHEAFHQYLDDYLDAAPQWFNEGLGDYFGAFQYVQGQGTSDKMISRPDKGRLNNVQAGIRRDILPAASDLMRMSQREMYNPQMAALHYAEAWAIIYFLIEGKRPEYRRMLVNYYSLLHKGKDLNEAYDGSFGKIDMGKFDLEWRGFIMGLGQN